MREQLNATPKAPGTFQLIWFHATGIDADTRYRQAFATFYGYVHLSPRYPNQHLPSMECVYFDYNAAFDMPDIEALILTGKTTLQVSVNEFATRADEFRSSDLYRAFADRGDIYDPVKLESDGKIIACRFDGPRTMKPPRFKLYKSRQGFSTRRFAWIAGPVARSYVGKLVIINPISSPAWPLYPIRASIC